MSHEETQIELAPGVTVLTGPNNIGKSAVVEAIRSVAENPASQDLIRHGASKAIVTIELDSGEIISWERTPGSPRYRIVKDGKEEVYAKIGNSVPDDVKKLLRISPVVTGDGDEVNVHIALQKDPIFIPSGSRAAGFFAASTEAHYLVRMQQLLKSKADAKKARKKEIEAEIAKLTRQIDSYAPLDTVQEIFHVIDRLEAEIKALDEAIPRLSQSIGTLEQTIADRNMLSEQNGILAGLEEPPSLKPVRALEELVAGLDFVAGQISLLGEMRKFLELTQIPPELNPTRVLSDVISRIEGEESLTELLRKEEHVLRGLESPPPVHPSAQLADTVLEIERLEESLRRLLEASRVLSHLEPVPELLDTKMLENIIIEMESISKSLRFLGNISRGLSALSPPPELKSLREISELADLIQQLEDMDRRVAIGRECYKNVEKACGDKRVQIESRLATIRICPVCRQPIDLEHFLRERI